MANTKEKRSKSIKVRLTQHEHDELMLRGKTKPQLAAWMRELALGEKPKKAVPKVDPELICHLGLIGNNLNQIARKLNTLETFDQIKLLLVLSNIQNEIERLSK